MRAELKALTDDNKRLNRDNEALRAQLDVTESYPPEVEAMVRAKVGAGLPRDMAVEVAMRQYQLDQAAKAEKQAREPKPEAKQPLAARQKSTDGK